MSPADPRIRRRVVGMRRWDALSRTTTDWFGLYNDPELCFPDGNLLIYLRHPDSSRRAPSYRLHAQYLQRRGFQSLVSQCTEFCNTDHAAVPGKVSIKQLSLLGPKDVDKAALTRDHVATRNLFAWLYDRPMAGKTLGSSLVDVMDRIHRHRPRNASNNQDMLAYLGRRGYLDFRECVEHALAVLHLAERYQMEELWVDAFAHCVGMEQDLRTSSEFDAISLVTKAMIVRARQEMEERLDRVAQSVSAFFDGDLSGSYLGLDQKAKDHMDKFRSFLHSSYIETRGFWPPTGFDSSFALRRSLYHSMYVDFRALYEYLVDRDPNLVFGRDQRMRGGICVLQNVRAFDDRYNVETLPHPHPLLPVAQDIVSPLVLCPKKRREEKDIQNRALARSLREAANRERELLQMRLVRSYQEFELQAIFEDTDAINPAEGRKVRWILIYAIFQMLASVISAPKDVRDTEGLSYPLCCQRPKTMPWKANIKQSALTPDEDQRHVHTEEELRPDVDYRPVQRTSSSRSPRTSSRRKSKSSLRSSLLHLLHRRTMAKDRATARDSSSIPVYGSGIGNGLNASADNASKTPTNATSQRSTPTGTTSITRTSINPPTPALSRPASISSRPRPSPLALHPSHSSSSLPLPQLSPRSPSAQFPSAATTTPDKPTIWHDIIRHPNAPGPSSSISSLSTPSQQSTISNGNTSDGTSDTSASDDDYDAAKRGAAKVKQKRQEQVRI